MREVDRRRVGLDTRGTITESHRVDPTRYLSVRWLRVYDCLFSSGDFSPHITQVEFLVGEIAASTPQPSKTTSTVWPAATIVLDRQNRPKSVQDRYRDDKSYQD